jgi:prepilin-type N-terminal cleavage/methylation domain-containing protein
MNNRGFSLVELVVIISIIGILSTIAALSFSSWMLKANIEKQTREMFTDLNSARSNSIYQKKRHGMILQPSSYIIKRYSSADESRTGDATKGVILTKNLTYPITSESGGSLANQIIEFDIRGTTNDLVDIRATPVNSGSPYDCIVISVTRINLGRMEGGACVQK